MVKYTNHIHPFKPMHKVLVGCTLHSPIFGLPMPVLWKRDKRSEAVLKDTTQ